MDKNQRQARLFEAQVRAVAIEGQESTEQWVEGYAVRFDSQTVLFEMDGIEFKEQIARDAFTGAKMDDVVFNYNHGGKVMARTRNGTLTLEVSDDGLLIRARLDGTEEGRRLYDEIQKGYIDRMSFRFTIADEEYDRNQHLWTVKRIKRLWDVSAVDIPAYDDTLIEARKADAVEARQECAEAEARIHRQAAVAALERQRLILKLKL